MTFVLFGMWTVVVVYSCILWWMHQRIKRMEDIMATTLKFLTSLGHVAEGVSKAIKEHQDAKEQGTETE